MAVTSIVTAVVLLRVVPVPHLLKPVGLSVEELCGQAGMGFMAQWRPWSCRLDSAHLGLNRMTVMRDKRIGLPFESLSSG